MPPRERNANGGLAIELRGGQDVLGCEGGICVLHPFAVPSSLLCGYRSAGLIVSAGGGEYVREDLC